MRKQSVPVHQQIHGYKCVQEIIRVLLTLTDVKEKYEEVFIDAQYLMHVADVP